MNNAALRFDRNFHMRTNDDFIKKVDALRRAEDDIPPAADMVRRVVDRAYNSLKITKQKQ